MYKPIGIIFSLLFGSITCCQSQFVYFDKLYDFRPNGFVSVEGGDGILNSPDGNGYFFSSYSYYGNLSDALLIKVDENGDTVFTVRKSDSDTKYFPASLVASHDTGYVICSSVINNINNNRDYSLIKISTNNEIVFSKNYGDTINSEHAMQVIRTNDKGFLIVGQSLVPPNVSADMYVVKTDSAGNFEWDEYYGGSSFEGAYSAVQTPDSGYMVLGSTQSFGNGQEDFYLVKADKQGNPQWQKTYGSSTIDIGSGIIKLSDGNYLLSGGGGVSGRLIKITPQGVVIWQKNYIYQGGTDANFLYLAMELPDKSIVAAGGTNNTSESDAGWIMKTDSLGTLLWQRKFNKTSDVELFYDFVSTYDKGFLLCGQARNLQTNNQDAWLLKVDSIGCAYEDCLVGIDEAGSKKVLVDVYPNPVSKILSIKLQETGNYELRIHDLQGKFIYQTMLTDKNLMIDVSNFANGIYYLSLRNHEQRSNLKLIIQH